MHSHLLTDSICYNQIMRTQTVEISRRTIVFTVFFLLGLWLVWELRDLLFSLLIAFILMSALKPTVEKLEKRRLSHSLSVAIVYLSFILSFVLLFSVVIPPLLEESTSLFINVPSILAQLSPKLSQYLQTLSFGQYLPDETNQVFRFITRIFSNTIFLVATLFFGFYFLLEEKHMVNLLSTYATKEIAERATSVVDRASSRVS